MLSADADIADSVDLLGKVASDLQEEIELSDNKLIGTSKYVTGYTGFSGNASEQSGNYLAIHFEDEHEIAAKLTAELTDGTSGEVTLDNDGICVFRLNAPATLSTIMLRAYDEDDALLGSLSIDISELTLAQS